MHARHGWHGTRRPRCRVKMSRAHAPIRKEKKVFFVCFVTRLSKAKQVTKMSSSKH